MNLDELNSKHQDDQSEKAFEEIARVAGMYYQALIASKLPDKLARQMVRDYYRIQWFKMFYPNDVPSLGD